jgi:hypothetical protein
MQEWSRGSAARLRARCGYPLHPWGSCYSACGTTRMAVGSHRVGVRSGCSWDRRSSLEKPSPYARVPNELCRFVAVHRLSYGLQMILTSAVGVRLRPAETAEQGS